MKITGSFLLSLFLLVMLAFSFQSSGVFICGLMGMFIIDLCAGKDKRELSKYVCFVFFVSIIFLCLHYYSLIEAFGKPYYGTDDERFELAGQQLVDKNIYWLKDIPYIAGMHYAKGYCLVIAYIIRICCLFGGQYCTFAPRVLNICLWIATCVLIYRLICSKTEKLFAKKLFLVLTLFPNALYISSFVYRDTLVVFLVTLFAFLFIEEDNKKEKKNRKYLLVKVLLMLGIIYLMIYIRIQMLFVLGLIVVFHYASYYLANITTRYIGYILVGLICLLVLSLFGAVEWIGLFSEQYTAYRVSQVTGLSRFIFAMPMLPFGIICRSIYGLCIPFPAEILSLELSTPIYSFIRFIICIGTIYQIFLIPYLLRKIFKLEIESLIFITIYMSIISTTFTFRHFLLCYPFLALTMGDGFYHTDIRKRKQYISLILLSLAILAVLYVIFVVF